MEMTQKAQAAIEFLIVALVVLLLLFLSIVLTVQYNFFSNQLLTASTELTECNKIADTVSEIYAQQKIAQKNIFISKQTTIQRTILPSPQPGQIKVGQSFCNYFGMAKKCDNPPTCTIFSSDCAPYCATAGVPTGFSMALNNLGETYKISLGSDGFVVFTKMS